MEKIRVLNATWLKYMLVVLMIFNHIYDIFGFTGKIPVFFDLLGLPVAPCFLILMVNGFDLTSNRKKYYQRLWMIAAIMGVVHCLMKNAGFAVRGDGYFLTNGIVSNFLLLFVILLGIESLQQRKYIKGCLMITAPFAWGALLVYILRFFPATRMAVGLIHWILFPNMFWLDCDGGFPFILTGIAIYLARKNRTVQIIVGMIAFAVSFIFIYPFQYVILYGIPLSELGGFPYVYAKYLLGFIPMFFYNGQRGNGSSKFFYYFYPLHVYVLYVISGIVYEAINPGSGSYEAVVFPMIGVTVAVAGVFFLKNYLEAPDQKRKVAPDIIPVSNVPDTNE